MSQMRSAEGNAGRRGVCNVDGWHMRHACVYVCVHADEFGGRPGTADFRLVSTSAHIRKPGYLHIGPATTRLLAGLASSHLHVLRVLAAAVRACSLGG